MGRRKEKPCLAGRLKMTMFDKILMGFTLFVGGTIGFLFCITLLSGMGWVAFYYFIGKPLGMQDNKNYLIKFLIGFGTMSIFITMLYFLGDLFFKAL